jgi:DeoR/GlpR family transcriptional regulator of sugar metabolism
MGAKSGGCGSRRRCPCALVTDSPTLVHELCGCAHLRVISTDGDLNHELNLLTGALALETINKLNFSHAFVSARGASLLNGATTWETEIAASVRAVKARASGTFLLADASKFSKTAPHTIAPLNSFDGLIVDSALPERTRAELKAAGVKVLD